MSSCGFSTVFRYGQTGTGKTYTMEGIGKPSRVRVQAITINVCSYFERESKLYHNFRQEVCLQKQELFQGQ